MASWLIVERLVNWKADQENNFQVLGVSKRSQGAFRRMKAGDKLISYIGSRVSVLADVRERVDGNLHVTKRFGELNYDEPYPFYVRTRPIVVLPRNKWIDIHHYLGKLSFTKGRDWRNCFQRSVRSLSSVDSRILLEAISKAQSGPAE
jgi:hypothetical protein